MTLQFSQVYPLYKDQINHLLKNRSDMWSMGFRNGVISSHNTSEKRDSYISHLAPEYGSGYQEGVSYAIYKLAFHKTPKVEEIVEPKKDNTNKAIIVGFVVQNYDFTSNGIEKTALAFRHTSLIKTCYPKDTIGVVRITETIYNAKLEQRKLLSIIKFLKKY